MRAADDTASASQWRLKLLRIPEMSTTPSSSPLAGSRTAVAEQVHGLIPAQKCSAPWTRTGPPDGQRRADGVGAAQQLVPARTRGETDVERGLQRGCVAFAL